MLKMVDYMEQKYPIIFTTPIPFYLDDPSSCVYNDQLNNGVLLSVDIYLNKLRASTTHHFMTQYQVERLKEL